MSPEVYGRSSAVGDVITKGSSQRRVGAAVGATVGPVVGVDVGVDVVGAALGEIVGAAVGAVGADVGASDVGSLVGCSVSITHKHNCNCAASHVAPPNPNAIGPRKSEAAMVTSGDTVTDVLRLSATSTNTQSQRVP